MKKTKEIAMHTGCPCLKKCTTCVYELVLWSILYRTTSTDAGGAGRVATRIRRRQPAQSDGLAPQHCSCVSDRDRRMPRFHIFRPASVDPAPQRELPRRFGAPSSHPNSPTGTYDYSTAAPSPLLKPGQASIHDAGGACAGRAGNMAVACARDASST